MAAVPAKGLTVARRSCGMTVAWRWALSSICSGMPVRRAASWRRVQTEVAVKLQELVTTARDAMTARRVFAEPYQQDGVTVIAAAKVFGGGGGGGGHDHQGQEGEGGGFGLVARPVGAYVIEKGTVRWMPAVDVNHMASVAGVVAVALLVRRKRARRSARLTK